MKQLYARFDKYLSILLCFAVLMSILPIQAFAIDDINNEVVEENFEFDDSVYYVSSDTESKTFIYDENGNLISSTTEELDGEFDNLESIDNNISNEPINSNETEATDTDTNFDSDNILDDSIDNSDKSVCNCSGDSHNPDCSYYVEDSIEDMCSSCEVAGGNHSADCPLYEELVSNSICTCNQEVHTIDCPLYEAPVNECTCGAETEIHLSDCPLYIENIDSESTCDCELIDGLHNIDCSLYIAPTDECTCNTVDGIHLDSCPLYITPICNCEFVNEIHDVNCLMYQESILECTCGTTTNNHDKTCLLFEEIDMNFNIDELLLLETLIEIYNYLVDNEEFIDNLTNEEKDLISDRIEFIYSNIEVPSEDELHLKNSISNLLNRYLVTICLECGLTDGAHAENCINKIIKCDECEGLNGEHLTTCSQYVKICEECGGINGEHIGDCISELREIFDSCKCEEIIGIEKWDENFEHNEDCVFYIGRFDLTGDIYFDISFGTVSLTDTEYSGYDLDGNLITGEHNSINKYVITQTDPSIATENTIKVGDDNVSVSSDFIVILSGVNIQNLTLPALQVNNASPSTVAIILANDSSNILYGGKNRAGLEKTGGYNSDGILLVTCETGYDEWLMDDDSGHVDSNGHSGCDSDCGYLDARSGNAWDGTGVQTYYGGAGIGTKGYGSGGSNVAGVAAGTNALVNLIIAGGNITAIGAYGQSVSNSSGGGASIGTGSAATSNKIAGNIVGLKITGGTITAYRSDNSAACIGGGYRSGYVNLSIYGGTIDTTKTSSKLTSSKRVRAPAIGGGGGGTNSESPAGATINIYAGDIKAYGQYGAAIGSGAGGDKGTSEDVIINIYGGDIYAYTTKGNGNGAGAAIGTGGSTGIGNGGKATINISGGTIYASSELGADIGGGGTNSTSTSGVGGEGIITISGGDITAMTGGIGGGNANAGKGGNATLTISGGTINASSISGGNSKTNNGGNATVIVTDGVLNTGSMGGGITNSETANIGSAKVEIHDGEIHGQIIMDSTNLEEGTECYFKMYGGIIDMDFPNNGFDFNFSQADGAVVYIVGAGESTDEIATLSGGTIKNGSANNGGAIYIAGGGSMLMSGGTIEDCSAIVDGGAIYIDGGNFVMTGGTITNCEAVDGGAIYVKGGNIDIYNGTIDSNTASNNGGAIYATSDTTDILINVFDGQITNNEAGNHAGAIGASVDGNLKITINIGEEECLGVNKVIHDDEDCPIIKNNVADVFGGAFCLHGNSDGLLVNVYCGDVDGNLALRYPGSNTINQEGGKFAIYGGIIDPGVMVGGGIFEDNRLEAKIIKVRFWGNYEGAPTEPVIIECTLGVTLNFPANTYVNGSHELSGWTNVPNSQTGWVPVGGQYAVYEDDDEYLDYYAVWDAVVSFIVYIPDTLDIGSNGTGEIDIAADLNYFKKDSNLEVIVNSDFMLTNVEDSNDIIYYELRTSEPGINYVVSDGDMIASFQYNNTGNKTLTANILEVVNAGTYEGLLTFTIQYSEL